ncbi:MULTISPECIES: DUF4278 domain-containing protein [Tolypothrichaceae]|uniref:DUF4278 domain-containing protein n=1 Tax=Hassallia byssoidea VB512170 TaxID=1304833 RepID=A0A846H7G3_9CYAN|nr:DUF4278 domain-containing protein [Hassalia byssoidea]NEU72898.1 DUF4278 domain-containing protein [Hassalia byssoidea VB512170]
MKLYYRGLSYEYNSAEAAKKATRPFAPVRDKGCAYNLTYRGLTYRVDPNIQPAEVSTPPVAYQLIYRLIAYFVKKTHTGEVSGVSQPVDAVNIGKFLINNLGLQK